MPYTAVSNNSIKLLSEKNVKKYVLPSYNLENSFIRQIKLKNTDKQRAVYKIKCGKNSYCLKKIFYTVHDLLFIYSAVEWWYRNEINVPKILPTNNGSRFVNYRNMLFILTPWIDGRKCDYDNESDFIKMGINMANMHIVSKKFYPIPGSAIRHNNKILYNSVNLHLNNLLNFSNLAFNYKTSFSKIYLQYFNIALKLAKMACNAALTIDNNNLSRSLCHLDYVNKNIIFDENEDIWVIDFDNCKTDYCAHDIGYSLRRFLKRTSTNWNIKLTIQWLNSYNIINSLNIDDLKYVFVYLVFPQSYWKVSKNYFNSIHENNKYSIKLLEKSVNNLDAQLNFAYEFKNFIESKFKTSLY